MSLKYSQKKTKQTKKTGLKSLYGPSSKMEMKMFDSRSPSLTSLGSCTEPYSKY